MNQHSRASRYQEVVRSVNDHKRLSAVISDITREMEHLYEDNMQLRAAVAMYREIARRQSEAAKDAAAPVAPMTQRAAG